MKSHFSVALRTDALLPLDLLPVKPMDTPSGPVAVLTCTAVQESTFGMVLLTADLPAMESQPQAVSMTVHVHPQQVAWILHAPRDSTLGFLSAARTASPRSGQAG